MGSTSESRGTTSTTGPAPASTAAASACAGGVTPASDSPGPGGPPESPARRAASCSRVPSVSDPVIDGTYQERPPAVSGGGPKRAFGLKVHSWRGR